MGRGRRVPTIGARPTGSERDCGIDAGEVLSMNVETVETVESASEVKSEDADAILGRNGKQSTWKSYVYSATQLAETITPPSGAQASISDNWEIVPKSAKRLVKGPDGNDAVEEYEESTIMLNKASGLFEFLRNDSEFQEPGFTEATYKTTIGGDTRLQGSPSWDACGELAWFFKISEDGREGYGIWMDNHGWGGCGVFSRNFPAMYVFHYDADNPFDASALTGEEGSGYSQPAYDPSLLKAANIRILKEWRASPLQTSPRYNVTVHEKDGKCTVTIDPDELNSPNCYIGGKLLAQSTMFAGYQKGYGYESAGSYTDEEREAHANHNIYGFAGANNGSPTISLPVNGDVNNLSTQTYSLRTALATFYDHQENFDWAWKGATQDPVSFEFDLSDSIQKKRTTQAFNAYNWNGTYFSNNSVDVTKQVVKSFGDIVYEPSWTDGALHMLINMDTKSDQLASASSPPIWLMASSAGCRRVCRARLRSDWKRPVDVSTKRAIA